MRSADLRLSDLVRSTGVKLALVCAGIFIAAVIVTGGVIYTLIAKDLDTWLDQSISEVSGYLVHEYDEGGLAALAASVEQHAKAAEQDNEVFLLVNADGHKIAGNAAIFKVVDGWRDAKPSEFGYKGPHELRVLTTEVGNYRLIVGRSDEAVGEIGDIVEKASAVGVAIMSLGVLAAGLVVALRTNQRVERFSRALDRVGQGDLNARVEAEKRGGDDLDHIARSLNSTLDHLSSAIAAMQHVTVDIAHDLRSPIARLRNRLADALERAGENEPVSGEIEHAIAEADEITKTFDSLLQIAEIEAGERRQKFEDVDLLSVARQIADLYAPMAEESGGELILRPPSGRSPALIEGDRALIAQLLINLVENSLRHGAERPLIDIDVASGSEMHTLTVADNGAGIPKKEHERVLTRFYRLDQSRGSPGNGLGLTLVAAVTHLHGGTLSLQDNAPGLKVEVQIPAKQA